MSPRCWNCEAIILLGTICSNCKIASDWVDEYSQGGYPEGGESCANCRYLHQESDVDFSECEVEDPFDCPALPDNLATIE